MSAGRNGAALDFPRPGKPAGNAFVEAFNPKFRAGGLNGHRFLTLSDACEKTKE